MAITTNTNQSLAKPSWAALRSSPGQQQPTCGDWHSSKRSAPSSSPAAAMPVYSNRRGGSRPPPPTWAGDTFPALGSKGDLNLANETSDATAAVPIAAAVPTATAVSGPQQVAAACCSEDDLQMPPQQQQQAVTTHPTAGVRRSSSATSFAEVARQQQLVQPAQGWHQQQQQQQQLATPQPQPYRRRKSPGIRLTNQDLTTASVAQLDLQSQPYGSTSHHQRQQQQQQSVQLMQQQQQCHLRQLADLYPWCAAELLQEVLANVNNDKSAAAAALLELAPAGPDDHSGSSSSSSSSSSSRRDSSRPAGPTGETHSGDTANTAAAGMVFPEQPLQGSSSTWDVHGPGDGYDSDAYHALRCEALQLTRQWQKLLRRSSAAFAAGDHAAAKQFSCEAKAVKDAAGAAHAAAALKIEVMHNTNSAAGLWQLDLHGLHVREAVLAVQQRLELLQSLITDLTLQQRPAGPTSTTTSTSFRTCRGIAVPGTSSPSSSMSRREVTAATFGSGRSGQQVLRQLLLSDDQPLHLQQAALARQLRVVVGRGNHSSGGEASLPRAVESWLQQEQYKYVLRAGAIDVKLKRI